jgi:hypothetical protein
VSGLKVNKFNWLALGGISVARVPGCKAHEPSIFDEVGDSNVTAKAYGQREYLEGPSMDALISGQYR